MSGKIHFRGKTVERKNDRVPRNLSILRKTNSLLPTNVVCDSLQYDMDDFPSLPVSSENSSPQHKSSETKTLSYSHKLSSENSSPQHRLLETKTLSYSDKLKVPFQNRNVKLASVLIKDNPIKKLGTDKISSEACSSRSNKYIKLKETQQRTAGNSQQPRIKNETVPTKNNHDKKFDTGKIGKKTYSSILNNNETQQKPLTYTPQPENRVYNKQTNFENQVTKQNETLKVKFVSKSSSSNNNNKSCQSDVEYPSSKSIKCKIMFDQVLRKKDEQVTDVPNKKKKRKSKIKRTAAFQTGKITVLTPEVHSKILNQASSVNNTVNAKGVVTDINNEEEYPELGKYFVPSSQKENVVKKENKEDQAVEEEKINQVPVCNPEEIQKEPPWVAMPVVPEKKGKTESKAVHPKDPITVTFFDMLMAKSSKMKTKEIQEATPTVTTIVTTKSRSKKGLCQAPNLLDSSCPVVKRGKERENPKPKKPSPLKKIILLDRKLRKEQLLKLQSSNEETENELEKCDSSLPEMKSISEEPLSPDFSETSASFETSFDDMPSLLSNLEISSLSLTNDSQDEDNTNVPVKVTENLDQDSEHETIEPVLLEEKHLNVLESNDSLLKSLSEALVGSVEISEKEKAAKLLLHTRNFREYCNHLISKDIDDAVHALLDDLARFQDRLHQKDPVKARMKRRMIYGIKEVKKYIKLKKVKCIIIATDLENVQMEGGLNDVLSDIKSLAADHNIPCVFALGRKALGKVCRKPVPVSCIGIFNAEGSEVNFKKMAELLIQSKKDYAEILRNLTEKITEEEVAILLKARKEPETLCEIRITILRQHFLLSQNGDAKEENITKTD